MVRTSASSSLCRPTGWRDAIRLGLILVVTMAWAAGGALARDTDGGSTDLYQDALKRFWESDYKGAIIQLKNALKENPANTSARTLLARSYLMVGDAFAAEDELRRARKGGADDETTIVPLGKALLMQQRFDAVIGELQSGGRPPHIEAEILYLRGQAYLSLLRYDEAELAFNDARRLRRDHVGARLGQARVEVFRGNLEAADAAVGAITGLGEDDPEVWYLKGDIRRLMGDYGVALTAYDRAIDLQPGHLPSRNSRAAILLDAGSIEDAREDAEFVRAVDAADPHPVFILSQISMRLGEISDARALLKEAGLLITNLEATQGHSHPPTLLLGGLVQFAQENYSEAQRYVEAYLGLDPNQTGARILLARARMGAGDNAGAVRALEPVLRRSTRDTRVYIMIATALSRSNRHTAAARMLEKAVDLAPGDPVLRARLGLARVAIGKHVAGRGDIGAAFSSNPEETRLGVTLAMLHLKEGNYNTALRIAEDVIGRDPEDPVAYNVAGAAHLGTGDRETAKKRLETAVKLDPTFKPALMNLGRLNFREGNTEGAKNQYSRVVEVDPKAVGAMLALAEIAESESDDFEAIYWLLNAREADSEALEPLIRLIRTQLRVGETDAAAELASELRGKSAESVDAMETMGLVARAQGDATNAARYFFRMFRLADESPEKLVRASRLLFSVGDKSMARTGLMRAITRFPEYLSAHAALIRLEIQLGRLDSASERIKRLGNSHPNSALPNTLAGDLMLHLRRYDEAAAAYERALDTEPSSYLVVSHYEALRQAGTRQPPLDRIRDWVKSHPDDELARRTLARAYARSGQTDDAIEVYVSLLERRPDDPGLLNDLAWLYQKNGDSRAKEVAEKAYRLAPNHTGIMDTLGWILVNQGEVDRGRELLEGALSSSPGDVEIRYHLAVALDALGLRDQARGHLEMVVRSGSNAGAVDDARDLLRKLSGG